MIPLETKESGGKLLPHSVLREGGVFLGEASCNKKRKRDILLGTWNVRSLYSGSGKGLWGLEGVGSGQGQVAGACEYGNELSGCSIKCGEFLD
jgi:hypothetical protein